MICDKVIPLLSPFYDGELASAERWDVERHLAACPSCSQRLESIQRLSWLVESSPPADPPATLVTRVEQSLTVRPAAGEQFQPNRSRSAAVLALAAVAAVALVGMTIWNFSKSPAHDHHEMVQAFGEFLALYEQGHASALGLLARKYQGLPVTAAGATTALKRPTVAKATILANHQATQRYVLKMPCCDCVQTIYTCAGRNSLVLFEHEQEQPGWFQSRASIRAPCRGQTCCLVQLKEGLAATWPVSGGFVTVVGARDVDELGELVMEFRPGE